MKPRTWVLTAAAGLVLADASIVTLALPQLLRTFNTTVIGVAAVIGVYTIVLAAALLPAERIVRSRGSNQTAAAGFLLFAAASVLCAVSNALPLLLVARGIQALGGAAALVASFQLIQGGTQAGRRHWLLAAVLSSAIGPALGGALTQAFDWRAIFIVQIPFALAAAAMVVIPGKAPLPVVEPEADDATPAGPPRESALTWAALALTSAALTAVIFLLVLLLIAGWAISPLAAAATVSVLPFAALAGARTASRSSPQTRATTGALLIGAGVLPLAWIPSANVAWTFVPQILAGIGMGMALPAFAGELLPEKTTKDAARLLTARHVGIAVVLALLAPITSHQLNAATETAKLRGVALVLDAKLPPTSKLNLAPALLSGVDAEQPRAGLKKALQDHASDFTGSDKAAYDELSKRTDDTLIAAVSEAFRTAFVVTGAFAVLAALLLVAAAYETRTRRRLATALPAVAAAAALAVPVAYAGIERATAPTPVTLANPCHPGPLPGAGGITGFLQDRALQALDAAACRLHVSREELVLALADPQEAKQFKAKHGIDPRSPTSLLGGLLNP